ncbi:hypothetical protein FPZ54_10755 [Sphingomonas suaedae]|uniref:FAD-binding protein n=1 Tax=Sphingomonas suaedae TaxID=2599297 RepID=A0A518RG72_9SPHN|nr:hypothetical protein [Sphingomonas suaedae]QDX26455.1 hypothetical protein FPZ54_10755 [Sphingomonas suaedae]
MARITYETRKDWQNYHLTLTNDIDDYGIFDREEEGCCAKGSPLSGPELFRATRGPLHDYIAKAVKDRVAAGMIGRAWSFAPLAGSNRRELDLTGLQGCTRATAADLHPDCSDAPEDVAFVRGGTTLRCLVEWAKNLSPRRSIMTSGTHLGPTVAGGFGTASHGSRLGFGGLQDMVMGMHLITGEKESVWIEPARAPVLSGAAASRFATRIIRSDAMFDDALIHLGGMGIVNGVALRLAPYHSYNVLAVVHPLWPDWEAQVEQGRFREIAAQLGHDDDPAFYEVTIDPFDNDGTRDAIHLMYFIAPPGLLPPDGGDGTPLPHAGDSIAGFAKELVRRKSESEAHGLWPEGFSAFSYYKGLVREFYGAFTLPITPASPALGWEHLHRDVVTGNAPGALYNASYAIRRDEVGRALPLILSAARDLEPAFLNTIRFVTRPSGTLAFTRFEETAVIEIDGLSDNLPDALPDEVPDEARAWGVFTKTGAMKIRTEFDLNGIDYSMHWAKLGQLDAPKVERDFGPRDDPASPIGRWRATRTALLAPEARAVFVNDALRTYKLVP